MFTQQKISALRTRVNCGNTDFLTIVLQQKSTRLIHVIEQDGMIPLREELRLEIDPLFRLPLGEVLAKGEIQWGFTIPAFAGMTEEISAFIL